MLHPGEFVLGSTLETVSLPDDLAARVEGKSSLGRLGLLTHATAGFVDPGFTGHVTLELSNVATLPIMLWPGMKIGQLAFFRLSSSAENPYGSATLRLALPGPARPDGQPQLPELPPSRRLIPAWGAPASGTAYVEVRVTAPDADDRHPPGPPPRGGAPGCLRQGAARGHLRLPVGGGGGGDAGAPAPHRVDRGALRGHPGAGPRRTPL